MTVTMKKWLKGIGIAFAGVLLSAFAAFGWLAGTASGGNWLLHTALPHATPYLPANMQLAVDGLETDGLADIRAARLTLRDADGIWLEVEQLRLLWSPLSLLGGNIRIEEATASRIALLRSPTPLEEDASPALPAREQIISTLESLEQLPETFARLTPPPLALERLSITRLELPAGEDTAPLVYTVEGKAHFLSSPLSAEVVLNGLEGIVTTARIALDGTPADIRLTATWQEEAGGLLGSALQLATPAPLHLELTGNLKQADSSLALSANTGAQPLFNLRFANKQLTADLPTPTLLTPLASFPAPVVLTGQLTTGSEPNLALHLATDSFTPAAGSTFAQTSLDTRLALRDGNIPFMLSLDAQTSLARPDSAPLPLTFHLLAKGSTEDWQIAELNATAAQTTFTAQGTADIDDGSAQLKGDLHLALPLEAEGAITQSATVNIEATASSLWESPSYTAQTTLAALDAALTESTSALLPLPLTLSLQGTADAAELKVESQTLTGTGTYNAKAEDNSLANLSLRLAAPDLPVVTLGLTHRADNAGTFLLAAEGDHQPRLSGDYRMTDTAFRLGKLLAEAKDSLRLTGDITLNTETSLAEGQLSGSLSSLAFLQDFGLADPTLRLGTGITKIILTQPRGLQHIGLSFDATGIASGATTLDSARLKATATLPADKSPTLDAQLDLAKLSGGIGMDSARVKVKGAFDALDITLDASELAGMRSFNASARLATAEHTTLTLRSLKGGWPQKNQLSLSKASTLTLRADGLTLSPLELRINDTGRITAQANLGAEKVDGSVTIDGLRFSSLPAAALHQLRGGIKGDIRLSGPSATPRLTFDLQGEGLQKLYPRMDDKLHSSPLAASLKGSIASGKLNAQIKADSADNASHLTGAFAMPLALSLAPGAYSATPGEKLDANLKADIQLASFLPLLLPDGVYGNGHFTADFTVKGALEAPDIRGNIALDSGRMEVLSTGTVLEDITLRASARGSRVTLQQGTAKSGDEGTLTLSGWVELTPDSPLDIKTTFNKATVMEHPNIRAIVSGDLSLEGDADASELAGKFTIDRARIAIAGGKGKTSAPEVPVIEVASLNSPISLRAEQDEAGKKAKGDFVSNMALDLSVNAPNQIFIEGFGLDAELKAALNIKGRATDPRLDGKMETLRGRWQFVGRSFTINRGVVTLQPDDLTNPTLDIACEASAGGNATAIATITGRANKPNIKFSSIPAMPQDEILARVMFGKNLNSISPFQALELAQMIATLNGKGGDIGIVSQMKDAFGIDDLTVGGGDGADDPVTVGVGKHISDNVYLGVEGGAGENSGKVSVEVDLTPSISVETEARQNAETAVRLNYKYDY